MAKAGDQSDGGGADPVQAYIDDIAAEHRAVFDRLHGLILHACPQAAVVLSYGIPTYKHGGRRLYLGAWKHGMSIYGWQKDQDGGFVSRHPELKTSTGTIRLPPQDAAGSPTRSSPASSGRRWRPADRSEHSNRLLGTSMVRAGSVFSRSVA